MKQICSLAVPILSLAFGMLACMASCQGSAAGSQAKSPSNTNTGRKLHFVYAIYNPDELGITKNADWKGKTMEYLKTLWDMVKNDPDPSLMIHFTEKGSTSEADPNLAKEALDQQQVIDIFAECERQRISFFYQAGVPTALNTTISSCERIFKVAPTTCKGVVVGELFNSGAGWKYIPELTALRNLCKRYGRKMMWMEHSRDGTRGMGWWGVPIANNKEWADLFSKEYADTIIPMHETNDPRVESLNMSACLGMWLGGIANDWGFSIQNWYWNDSGYGDPSQCPPELVNRVSIEAASVGSTYVEYEHPVMVWNETSLHLNSISGEGMLNLPPFPAGQTGVWKLASGYTKGIKRFIDLYKAGKIPVPDKKDILSLSPIALKAGKWNGRDWQIMDSVAQHPDTPQVYIPNYFYNEKKFREGLIPDTPYGILPLFTANADPSVIKSCKHLLTTDGSEAVYNGQNLSPDQTRETILSIMKKEKSLPLRVDNAYGVLTRLDDKSYMLWLVNSKEKDPTHVVAHVKFSLPGPATYDVLDRETGKPFAQITGSATMDIPLDLYRLLEVRRSN